MIAQGKINVPVAANLLYLKFRDQLTAVSTDSVQIQRAPLEHIEANHFPLDAFGERAALAFIFNVLEQVFEAVNVFE
jgi:hypothetical protein